MKLDFAKNVRRNMLANAMSSGIKLLFPFLNRTLFLWLLGPAYLGLNGLFTSVLGVLMLAEMGFGTAVVCSMYKPVADDDREQICAYLNFYRTVYRCIGAVIFVIGLCLLPFLRHLVHGAVPSDVNLHVLYLIHLVNTSASYFLFAYRGSVLAAYHRNDVLTNIRTGVQVAQYATVCLILFITRNYYHYVLAMVVFTVMQNLLIVKSSRRILPDITPRGKLAEDRRRRVVSDVKSIFLHKVGAVITNSTDNLVISAFLGLVAVAAYGNYYYVATSIAGLVGIIYTSTTSGFGNKIYTESKADNFKLFMKMNRISLAVILVCSAMMAALYQPFIAIWTKGDASLIRHALTPALMVFYFYINQSRQTLLSFKSAAGIWRQDRWKPIVAGAVNLGTNVLLVTTLPAAYKLDGVIFSTILGFVLIQIPWESHAVFTAFFGKAESRAYWRQQARFALSAVVVCAAAWGAVSLVEVRGLLGLATKGIVAAGVSGTLAAALFHRDVRAVLSWLSESHAWRRSAKG